MASMNTCSFTGNLTRDAEIRQVGEAEVAAFGIAGSGSHGFKRLFMTHPPLAERIAALEAAATSPARAAASKSINCLASSSACNSASAAAAAWFAA